MKKRILINNTIVLFIVFILIISACQPTPSTPIVVNKADNYVEQKTQQTASSVVSGIAVLPEMWKDTFYSIDGKVEFIIDGKIELTDTSIYNVLNVKPANFSPEQIETAAKSLFNGAQVYSGKDLLTKDIINERIIAIEKEISDYKSKNENGMYDFIINEYENSIIHFQKLYKTASDVLPKNPPVYELRENEAVNLYTEMDGKEMRYINVLDSGKDSELEYRTDREYTLTKETVEIGTSVSGEINFTEARKTAERYLSELGAGFMGLSFQRTGRKTTESVSGGQESLVTTNSDTDINNRGPKYDESVQPCYVFYYTRCIDGVLATYVNMHNGTTVTGVDGAKTYREPWENEYIEIMVDKEGIAKLRWHSPSEVTGYAYKNVSIISPEEAKETGKKYMQIMYNGFVVNDKIKMYITNIVLGMARVAVEGEENKYMYIPVWDYFGYYTTETLSGKKGVSDKNAYTLLTVNAIDGSIIDRGLGY